MYKKIKRLLDIILSRLIELLDFFRSKVLFKFFHRFFHMKEPVCIIMCVRCDKVCEIMLNELITYFLNLFPKLANVTCGSHLCEYGLIYPDRELTTKALTEFFDGNVSESTVFRHLTKHFKRIGKYKNSEYRNPRGALENNKQAFKLTEPKYMRLN